MPNWCNNNITISGPTETIKTLWDDAQTAHVFTVEVDGEEITKREFGLLNAMVPIGDWEYGTAVDTWGTKWDISDEGLEFIDHGDGTAEITGWFDSAWAPPVEAYNKFLDDMDNCSIEASYYEMGMDFAGFYSDGNDEELSGLYEEYKQPEDERSDLFNRLDEEWGLSEQFADYDDEDEEMLEDE
jgi:hypothetical protein